MISIPIREFISGSKIPVDVFIKLGDSKFVLLVKAGDVLQLERASQYEQKQVEELFVRKDDYQKYMKQNLAIAGVILSKEEVQNRKKLDIVSTTLGNVCVSLEKSGLDPKTLEQAKVVLTATVELVESKNVLGELIMALHSLSDELLSHSVGVAVIAAGMGHAAGWTQASTIEKLALGGLFHDVGLRQLPPDLINKPCAMMDFEEVQMYESHPIRGQQILQSLGFIPEDVISIVYEHHENQAGQGYPRRLKGVRIHPLAKFVALADVYCENLLKNPNNPVPKTALEALVYLRQNMQPLYSKEAFRALEQFLYPVAQPRAA